MSQTQLLFERFRVLSPSDKFLWCAVALLLLYALRQIVEGGFLAAAPQLGWRPLGADESPARVAQRAEELYGRELREAGFKHLGSGRRWLVLGSRHDFDYWAAPELRMFAIVLGNSSGLFLCSYLRDGPAVVLTGNYRGRTRRAPGYWRQYLEKGSLESLLAAQQQQLKEFLQEGSGTWTPWTDFTFDGKIAAEKAFDRGFGQSALALNAAMRLTTLFYVALMVFELIGKKPRH